VEPFAPRRVRSHGTRETNGWRLKVYSISYDGGPPDWSVFTPALALVDAALPTPAQASGRAGLGFVIAHSGRGMWYTVLCWWDRENELPIRVWVAEQNDAAPTWRAARESESVCVWDLDVIWQERQAYVETILAEPNGAPDQAYLARTSS
jgi:hypothetical protein